MSIGSRLREEREKINMTQEDFAIACGVRRRAQSSYESDTRSPDAKYLEAATKIGVDISYVIYGQENTFQNTLRNMVIEDLFSLICYELGISDEDTLLLIENSVSIAQEIYKKNEEVDGIAADLVEPVKNFLKKNTKIATQCDDNSIDTNLLKTIIERLEFSLEQKKIRFKPEKKALAAITLYRSFKASGKVDQQMIEDLIDLASQSAA
ncbi:MAG: helix-turn-helix transcriptional regulator [Burkholderiales bacterium]|nr:helix-turn-helix transcriptional regulator [Burkholderiales bacterium]